MKFWNNKLTQGVQKLNTYKWLWKLYSRNLAKYEKVKLCELMNVIFLVHNENICGLCLLAFCLILKLDDFVLLILFYLNLFCERVFDISRSLIIQALHNILLSILKLMLPGYFWLILRGCSDGGELTRLGGLAHLGETSSSSKKLL